MLRPFQVSLHGQDLTPTAGKLRTVLALFALRNDQTVSTEEFIHELWPENPPKTAQATVQTYVYKLRKVLGVTPCATELLRTETHGYRFAVPADSLDFRVFEKLARHARTALDQGHSEQAAHGCQQALALWEGPALAGVSRGDLLSGLLMRLDEARIRTLETRIEADLRLGRHRELIPEIREAIHGQPLHEEFHRQLMLALYRSGRCSEALAVYRRLWQLLGDEIGTEPSAPLRLLHRQMLAAEVSETPAAPVALPPRAMPPSPTLLPPDLPGFVGRVQQLERCENWLRTDRATGSSARLLSVTGAPGVGKNAFAVRLAHQLSGAFEDGRLYADLSEGTTGEYAALGVFLRELGVPDSSIPTTLDEREAFFRARTTGGRFLVVLRAPSGTAQIGRLTPNSPDSAVIVVRGPRYSGPPGAWVLGLRLLRPDEGVALLAALAGEEAVTAERDDAERLVRLSGHLPMALRAIGARLRDAHRLGEVQALSRLHRELERASRTGDRLGAFTYDGQDLRGRLAMYSSHLTPRELAVFRLIGAQSRNEVTPWQLAPLLRCDEAEAYALLCRLLERNLLDITEDAKGGATFFCHPLVRRYAREISGRPLPPAARRPGGGRDPLLLQP